MCVVGLQRVVGYVITKSTKRRKTKSHVCPEVFSSGYRLGSRIARKRDPVCMLLIAPMTGCCSLWAWKAVYRDIQSTCYSHLAATAAESTTATCLIVEESTADIDERRNEPPMLICCHSWSDLDALSSPRSSSVSER